MVMLNTMGEILTLDGGEVHEFWINQFGPDRFHPRGDRYLKRFELGHEAAWEYDVVGVRITKRVMLLWKRDVAGIRYEIDPAGRSVELQLLPLVSIRDFHSLQRGTDKKYDIHTDQQRVAITSGSHTLHLVVEGDAKWKDQPDWWKGFSIPSKMTRAGRH